MPEQFNAIDVVFRGKEYTCRPTHRAIFHAEKALEVNILTPNEPHLFKQPLSHIVVGILYLLLRTKLPNITQDECFDAFIEDQEACTAVADKFTEALRGVLTWMPKEAAKPEAPLAVTSSGESDGPPQELSSASPTENSGD
jgi:hypothetical protein